jgi:DNA-binding transcriptional ArsR family regulator
MDRLADIFSSRSRTEVLEILAEHNEPVHLRAIVELSSVSLRAIQEALEVLYAEGILRKRKKGNKVLFSLNTKHQAYSLICNVAQCSREHYLESRAVTYAAQAQSALEFASSAHELFSEVRDLNK